MASAPSPSNFGVNNDNNKVTYAIPKQYLKDTTMTFSIEPVSDSSGESQAVFQLKDKTGQVVRQNVSQPFPTGTLQKKSAKMKSDSFVVELKKKGKVDLNDYFKSC